VINIFSIWSCLLLSALFLKAAQFFFYPWLLDAMEAPVPISAQLHSSTLVIIGFYILVRFFFIINNWQYSQIILLIFGLSTSISASLLGFKQDDGKKLLACSTAGQLGYVIIAFGIGLIEEALILLIFCCCNKAYIFVWFGSIMEKCSGFSDLRIIGGIHYVFYEKLGLIISIINSTILPGSFIWHTKSILNRGLLVNEFQLIWLGLEILNLTWFLTTLYLLKLTTYLFSSTSKNHIIIKSNLPVQEWRTISVASSKASTTTEPSTSQVSTQPKA